MHDENKGMWCSLCAEHTLYEENWTLKCHGKYDVFK
jgi:hypothetical protein